MDILQASHIHCCLYQIHKVDMKKKLQISLLTIALSAFLISVSYSNANEPLPNNTIINSTIADTLFADSFDILKDESTQASTTDNDAEIQQAITNSHFSIDGNAQQDIESFNIFNSSGNNLIGSSSNENENKSETIFDDVITSNEVSSDVTVTADVGTLNTTQISTLTQSYIQNE